MVYSPFVIAYQQFKEWQLILFIFLCVHSFSTWQESNKISNIGSFKAAAQNIYNHCDSTKLSNLRWMLNIIQYFLLQLFSIYIHTHKHTHRHNALLRLTIYKLNSGPVRNTQEHTGSQCTGRRQDGVKDVSEKGTDAFIHILYNLGVHVVLFKKLNPPPITSPVAGEIKAPSWHHFCKYTTSKYIHILLYCTSKMHINHKC